MEEFMSYGMIVLIVLRHGTWDLSQWNILSGIETEVIYFMEHQQIFATNIFLIDEFIPQSVKAEKKVIDDMKKYISDFYLIYY